MGICQRITKRIRMTRDAYRTDCLFSRRLARYRFVDDIGYRLRFYKAADRAHQKKDAYILSWLKKELASVFDAYRDENTETETWGGAMLQKCTYLGLLVERV